MINSEKNSPRINGETEVGQMIMMILILRIYFLIFLEEMLLMVVISFLMVSESGQEDKIIHIININNKDKISKDLLI